MKRLLLFTIFVLIATLSFSKGRYSVFYIKGEVTVLVKGKEVRLKEKEQLSPKDFVSVPHRCGLILKDEKGRRICVIKKPYRGKLSLVVKESRDDSSIIDCTLDFFKYLGKRCFGDMKDDSTYMRRTASTSRGEQREASTEEEQYIDTINEIIKKLETDILFQQD